MKISSIKIQRFYGENTRLKAIVTVTFDKCIVVRDVKIIASQDNVFVAMPSIKLRTGEFKDICHPLTPEFRDYIQKNIIDVFNSGESEKVFENEFTEPKINIKIKSILDNDLIVGECSVAFDDKFVVHNIKIVRIKGKGLTVIFPYRKTQTDNTINVCELINNKDKYCNQIIDAYLKMTENNSSNSNNNIEQSNSDNKNDNNDVPGWDAITAEAERVYPTQKNPKHYGTLIKYKFGGKDPIDGISVYDGGNYWHFITYGISELYEKETDNKEISGYGMEFTFKLKKDNYENEESEIKNICGILQGFAKITFSKGELFNEYEYLYSGQIAGIDANKKSNLTGFITIPDKEFRPIDTPNGKVKFVEFIGVTDDELKAIMDKKIKVKELYEMLGSDVTDYHRKSIFENIGDKIVKNEQLGFEISIPSNWKNVSLDKLNQVEELKQLAFGLVSQNGIELIIGIDKIDNNTFENIYNIKMENIKESGRLILSQNIIEHDNIQIRNIFIKKNDGTTVCQNFFEKNGYFCDVHWMVREESNLDDVVSSEKMKVMYSLKRINNEKMKQSANTDELKTYTFEAPGCPKFVFYFPENLGELEKPYSNVFEIKKDKIQKVRVMVSKCASIDNFEYDTRKWIEKNKTDAKMEEVAHRKETINNISLEVYELKYSEHSDWAHKIYKIGFVNGCRVTISGWAVKGREEIINQAFERIEY